MYFVLRTVDTHGCKECNQLLGNSYKYELMLESEDYFAKVYPEGSETPIRLSKWVDYYVMCSDGKTFEKLNYN